MVQRMDSNSLEQTQVSQDLPASVREYASKYNLGLPLMASRDYRLVRLSLIGQVLRVMGLLGGAGYFLKGYIDGINLDREYPLPADNYYERLFQGTQQALFCVTLLLVLMALFYGFFLWLSYREAQRKLYLCQRGLLRLGKNAEEVLYWDEVVDIYGASDKLLYLRREGGRKFKISESWPHNKAFDQRIAHIVTERLLPETIKRFERGVPISFGYLLITREGIRYFGRPIPWSDLVDALEMNGTLKFKAQGRWWRYGLIDAPLVAGLVKHAMRSRLVALLAKRAIYMQEAWGAYLAIEPRYRNANRKLAE